MFSYLFKKIMLGTFISVFLFFSFVIFAENNNTNFDELCTLENIEKSEKTLPLNDYRVLLENCEEYYEQKSNEIQKEINQTAQEKKTLSNEVYLLGRKIKNLDYQIYQGNIMVKDLTSQIQDTGVSIKNTGFKIEDIKERLSDVLQLRYEEDQISLVEIFLSGDNLSDFFDDLMALESLNVEIQELLKNIKGLKFDLESQKESMDIEKKDLENVTTIQVFQKQESAKAQQEQEYLLKLTEQEYQKHIREREETSQKSSEIRARIFELIGVPDAPTFEEALVIAEQIEKTIGVRPALLLAVLTQESNIGKNVGQCYLPKSSAENVARRIMAPGLPASKRDDVAHFLEITKELGRDPYNTPISCPWTYGWGGAMGPAQFIPSTWMIYKDKIKEITGRPADPWNVKDAFLAAGLYLARFGAASQTYTNEWKASMIYFSGTSRRTRYNGYGFYGDSVMALAVGYEKDIRAIQD